MTDPRCNDARLSLALRHAGGLGQRSPHQLMLRAAGTIEAIEQTLIIIHCAIERGDVELAKLRLQSLDRTLGCENVVMNNVCTDEYQHNEQRNTSINGN